MTASEPDAATLERALGMLHSAHEADPRCRQTPVGPRPLESVWCERVESWVRRLAPDAPAELRLAAAAQHLERWRWPRSGHPEGRAGYLRWRREVARAQAERARRICLDAGISGAVADRVAALVRKEDLASDDRTRVLEDAACLAFLELDLDDFADRHEEADVVRILVRTWRKMSDEGRAAAQRLDLSPRAAGLIEAALTPGSGT
ncbi:MAG: DUF4202 domain-containing protein [Gammaproteobacteria bacterium]|nr:DUF4202 domain-containing protein [Gammaproteobacteria bacterium]